MSTFNKSVELLTTNQKIVLAALLRSEPLFTTEDNDNFTLFATSEAKKFCKINPRGIGAICAGIGKRTEAANDDNILYLKNEIQRKGYGKHGIAIMNECLDEALEWAKSVPMSTEELDDAPEIEM